MFLLFFQAGGSQCPSGDLQLSTQQQVDEFALQFPTCTGISGNLTIGVPYGASDIHDISALSKIQKIEGFLHILNNSHLESLSGLEQLEHIDSSLVVFNNDRLINMDAMKNLNTTGGSLWINYNQQLNSLEGLHRLNAIDGSIDVSYNPHLSSFAGLQNIDPGTVSYTLGHSRSRIINIRAISNGSLLDQMPSMEYLDQADPDPVSRFQNMVGKTYADRVVVTDFLLTDMEFMQDSIKADFILNRIDEIADSSGDQNLVWEARLLREYNHLMQGSGPFPQRIARMEDLANRAGRAGQYLIQARALKIVSFRYWFEFPNYEKLFQTYHALEEVLERLDPEEFPDMAQCYMVMGRAHYFFRDYREAIHYFEKAARLPIIPFNTSYVLHSINNLGLCYQNLQIPDSSDLYFQRLLQDTTDHAVGIWKGIASGNLGYNHYTRKEYEEAIPLLERDYLTAESIDDWGLAAGSLTPLSDIMTSQNKLSEAEITISKARNYIRRSGQTDRLRKLFPVISKWHAAMGHKELAAAYVDSTLLATQTYNDKFNAVKLLRARQELNANELRLQEAQKQKLILQRNLIIAALILVFFLGISYQVNRTRNLKRKRKIRDLELKNTQESLDHAQTRLQNLTRKIRENNDLIDRMQQNYSSQTDQKMVRELQNATILTPEDWDQFKNNFTQVYPGFIEKLESRHPILTSAEIRCLCLQKLRMSNREIAAAQGVSPKSINVTNHRIRKKLNLENQEMLEELVFKI